MPEHAVSQHKLKKRKHAAEAAGEPSAKRSKTDSKKDKAAKTERRKEKKRDKGKARADDGQFKVIHATMAVSIPPVFANNLRAGVEEMLDSMVMRYIPAAQGVVLAHDSLQFVDPVAKIKADCPFANCRIAFAATVWSPRVGMKLVGKVNLCSPDHISLLLHRTFNVSIPRHHIPADQWEFEYGPAENDPEFGSGTVEETTEEAKQGDGNIEGGGRWVHKLTGEPLGGPEGYLEFTVIGLTIANQMLSLVGSIQLDPFSLEHVPERATLSSSDGKARELPQSNSAQEVEMMIGQDMLDDSSDSEKVALSSRVNATNSVHWDSAAKPEQDVTNEAPAKVTNMKSKEKKRKRSDKKDPTEPSGDHSSEGKKRKKAS